MFKFIKDEYCKDSFILFALQAKRFEINGTEFEISHNPNEGFNLLWDNGIDLGDDYLPTLAELVVSIGIAYDAAEYMTAEEIRDALIGKEDECDRPMLASLWATIGYINCGLDLGYEFTAEEIEGFRNQLKDI